MSEPALPNLIARSPNVDDTTAHNPMFNQEGVDLRTGSKSFYLASRLFDPKTRRGAAELYRWCRFVDDQIDFAPTAAQAHIRLDQLERATRQGAPLDARRELQALDQLCAIYPIDRRHAQDLIEGLRMDVDHFVYRNFEDLNLYAYRVAGVVGLMMCPIMGVKDKAAYPFAIALGRAMQFTNIARDVREDFYRGRVYLPQSWLKEPISKASFQSVAGKKNLFFVILKLLEAADQLYAEGLAGQRFLPFRARIAVVAAASIYREIGNEIRRRGPGASVGRVVLSRRRKIWVAVKGVARIKWGVPKKFAL